MRVTPRGDGQPWILTSVYGPRDDSEKQAFIEEIKHIHSLIYKPWLILEDFNLIYRACDKNNLNLNRRLMGSFRSALNHCDLKEIHLKGRKYTWSNKQENPTLEQIDRAFCNSDWDSLLRLSPTTPVDIGFRSLP